jgi:alpha/beta superfamily hydrolase
MDPVRFTTEDGLSLQGELRLPEGDAKGSAVVCHAHPRHGGSKDHPLLWAIRNELAQRGFAVLAFNFRGVMGSSGAYDGGVAEILDARAAIGRVRRETDGPTLLAGWSFGANVALRTAVDDDRPEALALVGLALDPREIEVPDLPDALALGSLRRPTLLIAGDDDPFCPPDGLRAVGGRLPGSEIVVVEGADHYFSSREREVASIIGGFAGRTLTDDPPHPGRSPSPR